MCMVEPAVWDLPGRKRSFIEEAKSDPEFSFINFGKRDSFGFFKN